VLNVVTLNRVRVMFGDAETTQRMIADRQAHGTVWQGQTAMCISVSSKTRTDANVERKLSAMLRVAERRLQGRSRVRLTCLTIL
jgi:hypothetical protein